MKELLWRIELEDGREFTGREEWKEGTVSVRRELPTGVLRAVSAEVSLPVPDGDKVFINGFQSWTACPEYGSEDRIRSLRHLPKAGVKYFGLDRYGDYYFVDYPDRKGLVHGESWMYFRRGEEYELIASLDEEPGYTLFRYDRRGGKLTIERDCAGLRCGGEFRALELFLARGGEDEVFDAWFAAMGVRPRTLEPIAGYSSWYNRYENINEECILSDLKGCEKHLRPGDLFQIDDGWEPGVGDWLEPDPVKFPNGMKPSVEAIHGAGFKAGLWLAPFVARKKSIVFEEHPDWLLRVDGKPWYCGVNWGGFYSLDIDHPEVREYLAKVFRRVFDEWGFDLVKLDFLYGAAPVGTAEESRAGRMIRAMDFLRELCGDKLILGCGVPMMPAFGRVEYCRIGCDVGLDWDGSWLMQQTHRERVSTRQSIGNTVFRRQLNRRAFLNDPDVFFLRTENLKLTEKQKKALSVINTLLGDVMLTSDDMNKYTPDQAKRYAALRRLKNAEDIRLDFSDGVAVSYTLDGKRSTLQILPGEKRKK
ncbi:MAG: alpha-galactosidase [Oscillospiraceae bacterium]|nr:alpha-galactosidase [Oscillospiraceae bacterium]